MLRNVSVLLAAVVLVALTMTAEAADKNETFTDPEKAGPDFAVQGEYVGAVHNGRKPFGIQIIALGDGKFDAVAYPGGLPGDGWDGREKLKGKGETKDGVTAIVEEGNGRVVNLGDGIITVKKGGVPIGAFKKVIRKSPTLGAKPPEGAVVLFDGTTADKFKGGKMTEDGLLMQGVTSNDTFQSFKIHMEFRTPFKPHARGQGRGNSGFYAHGRYEVQILDSFGLEGKQNECGGIYSVGPPKINMCFPPLSWQTFDIDFTAAKFEDGKKVKDAVMTVRHNGVLIHENQVVDHRTTASPLKEGPEPGPVFLQNHGNPVRFRNIWVVPTK